MMKDILVDNILCIESNDKYRIREIYEFLSDQDTGWVLDFNVITNSFGYSDEKWNRENWGTPGNARDISHLYDDIYKPYCIEYHFKTYESPPDLVIYKLAKIFSDVKIDFNGKTISG